MQAEDLLSRQADHEIEIDLNNVNYHKCKGDRSKAPGDSSVNYNLWNIVTTYLQEIPQRIR